MDDVKAREPVLSVAHINPLMEIIRLQGDEGPYRKQALVLRWRQCSRSFRLSSNSNHKVKDGALPFANDGMRRIIRNVSPW